MRTSKTTLRTEWASRAFTHHCVPFNEPETWAGATRAGKTTDYLPTVPGTIIQFGWARPDENGPRPPNHRHAIYWGTHGCELDRRHEPIIECECDCCECPDQCVPSCVAKFPHYGPLTQYYGDDKAVALWQGRDVK